MDIKINLEEDEEKESLGLRCPDCEVSKEAGISYPTAKKYLKKLVDEGVINEET